LPTAGRVSDRDVFRMKALVFHRPGHVEVNEVPDPKIEH